MCRLFQSCMVNTVMHLVVQTLSSHKAAVFQNLKLLRDCGLTDAKLSGKSFDTVVIFQQKCQELIPRWSSDQMKQFKIGHSAPRD